MKPAQYPEADGAVPPDKSLHKRVLGFALKLILAAAILCVILLHIDRARLLALISSASIIDMALAVAALTAGVFVAALRWKLITRVTGQELGLGLSVRAYLKSTFIGLFLPTSMGGDAARAVFATKAGLSLNSAVIGILIDRALGLFVVAACILAAYPLKYDVLASPPAMGAIFALGLVLTGGAVGAALLGFLLRNMRSPPKWAFPLQLLQTFYRTIASRQIVGIIVNQSIVLALGVYSFALCLKAINVPIDLLSAMIVMQGLTLASLLPASVGGWGAREGAAIVLMAPLGISAEEAFAVSFLLGICVSAVGLIGGLYWLVSDFGAGPA